MTTNAAKSHPVVRAVVDYGGLASFLIAYFLRLRFVSAAGPLGWSLAVGGTGPRDLTAATLWLVLGSAAALTTGLVVERRVALMPLITGGLAMVFGGLTLVFHDARFIKIKPTITNLLLAGGLLSGLLMRKNWLKLMIGEALPLPDAAWRTLTLRYGLFFLCMAALNEIVWRTQDNSIWVQFHTYGTMLLAVLFSLTQVPFLSKYMQDPHPPPPPTD